MKRIIICLIFLISFSNAIQCYNGKTYVDIPESKLSEIGYTEYNITHSSFDCKVAYKRYLKVKETEQVNISNIIENKKNELEEHSKIGSFLPIFLLVLIVFIIWIIKNIIREEPKDEFNLPVQKEPIKQKETVSVQKETIKTFDDISKKYSENLRKIKQEKVKNGFYNIPKPVNNSVDKTKSAYDLLLERPEWKAYRLKVLAERGKQCEWCGSNKNLHVHHKFYLKYPNGKKILPWEYDINCLLVLCKDCHAKAHKKYKIKSYYISY